MDPYRSAGIYAIVCLPTGRCYIGSAVRLRARYSLHYHQLSKGEHHSRFLQRAWDKYGPEAFEFRILLLCRPGDLQFFEQRALDSYKPDFNVSPSAISTLGLKHTPEQRSANSMRGKALRSTPEWRAAQSERIKRAAAEGRMAAAFDGHRAWLASVDRAVLRQKYTPEVRAKIAEKARSRAKVHIVDGQPYTVLSAAEAFGVSRGLLKARLARGWSLERAVHTPVDRENHSQNFTAQARAQMSGAALARAPRHPVGNKLYTVSEASEAFAIARTTIHSRLRLGWTLEQAVRTPVRHARRARSAEARIRIREAALARAPRHLVDGSFYSVSEATAAFGIGLSTIRRHLKGGWTLERTVHESLAKLPTPPSAAVNLTERRTKPSIKPGVK